MASPFLCPLPNSTTDIGDLTEFCITNLKTRGATPQDAESVRASLASFFSLRTQVSLTDFASTTAVTFGAIEHLLRCYFDQLCDLEKFSKANALCDERPLAAQAPGAVESAAKRGDPNGVPFPFSWALGERSARDKPISNFNYEKAHVLHALAVCVAILPPAISPPPLLSHPPPTPPPLPRHPARLQRPDQSGG